MTLWNIYRLDTDAELVCSCISSENLTYTLSWPSTLWSFILVRTEMISRVQMCFSGMKERSHHVQVTDVWDCWDEGYSARGRLGFICLLACSSSWRAERKDFTLSETKGNTVYCLWLELTKHFIRHEGQRLCKGHWSNMLSLSCNLGVNRWQNIK